MTTEEFKSIGKEWKIVKVLKLGSHSRLSKTYRIISDCRDSNRQSPYINYKATTQLYLYWDDEGGHTVFLGKREEEFEDDEVSRMEVIKSIPKEYLHLIFDKVFKNSK